LKRTYELLKAFAVEDRTATAGGDIFQGPVAQEPTGIRGGGRTGKCGGVYRSRTETFYAPFESLGLKPYGKGFTKDADYRADTLVHELTHQMMHFWLDYHPQWVVEGTAEYTGNLPTQHGGDFAWPPRRAG
jgi:hypothetical protein